MMIKDLSVDLNEAALADVRGGTRLTRVPAGDLQANAALGLNFAGHQSVDMAGQFQGRDFVAAYEPSQYNEIGQGNVLDRSWTSETYIGIAHSQFKGGLLGGLLD